jgi:hypothetical protein
MGSVRQFVGLSLVEKNTCSDFARYILYNLDHTKLYDTTVVLVDY